MKLNRLFYLGTLIIVFFTIGLVLSNLINEIFPACDFQKNDKFEYGKFTMCDIGGRLRHTF